MTTPVEPSKELLQLCKYWIPFLKKKHVRYGVWNKKELSIGDGASCMVAEAWGWMFSWSQCSECITIAHALDGMSEHNRSPNITPVQVNKMIRKGNTFATHFFKKHSK